MVEILDRLENRGRTNVKFAARILDPVLHPLPGVLQPGPGSFNVIIGNKPAWRAVPTASGAIIQAAKNVSDAVVAGFETATKAASGTPGAPAALAAEVAAKAAATTAMTSLMNAAGGGADIHICATMVPPPAPHGPGVVIDGSPTVLINNLPASRAQDTILEALGPPDKILMGQPDVIIGNGGASGSGGGGGGLGGAVSAMAGLIAALLSEPVYPRTQVMDDGTVATEFSENVFVTGTSAEQGETIRQLNAVRQGDGGQEFFEGLANRDDQVVLNVIGDPAQGRELHPGQQNYENCAPQSAQQLIRQATGNNYSEAQMETIANTPTDTGYVRDEGSYVSGVPDQLENGGVPAHSAPGTIATVDNALANDQGVLTQHDLSSLWGPEYDGLHTVNTTGGVQDQNGDTLAYTINDTGSDQNGRVMSAEDYQDSMSGHDIAVTDNPVW
ncbi:MAG: hypothetical protein ACR2PF_16960 [Rhizobiaceae bacterium]